MGIRSVPEASTETPAVMRLAQNSRNNAWWLISCSRADTTQVQQQSSEEQQLLFGGSLLGVQQSRLTEQTMEECSPRNEQACLCLLEVERTCTVDQGMSLLLLTALPDSKWLRQWRPAGLA